MVVEGGVVEGDEQVDVPLVVHPIRSAEGEDVLREIEDRGLEDAVCKEILQIASVDRLELRVAVAEPEVELPLADGRRSLGIDGTERTGNAFEGACLHIVAI